MNSSFLKNQSTRLVGATFILLGAAVAPSQATTLSGYSTYGSDMVGMRVTASFLDGTSQSLIWSATGSGAGGVFGTGWSLTEAGNTYPQTSNLSDARWVLSNYGQSITSLVIDAIPGNTVFDNVSGLGGPLDTPGSAEGWNFQPVLGLAPTSYAYSDPIDISYGDLFGRLSLYWGSGFTGMMQFIADTDSGTSSNPVQPRDPVAYNAPPNLSVSLSTPTIYESQSASACFSAYEPDQTAISFFLNGGYLGTVPNTLGTSSLCTNLGVFPDNGVYNYTVVARDDRGHSSQSTSTLTVLNLPPTVTSLTIPTIYEGQSATASITATDPGADAINFYLNGNYIGTDPSTSGTRAISTNLGVFADNGVLPYTAYAVDKDGGVSDPVARVLTVLNVPPTLTSFDLSNSVISQGQSVSALLSATDPGADWETFFINGKNVGTDLRTSGSRSVTTNLGTFLQPGTYTFTSQAQDKDGAFSNVITKTLQVLNVAPTITKMTQNLIAKAGEFFNFAASAFDPGGDKLTYQWDFSGNGLFQDFVGASGNWSFADPGTHLVKVRVSDGNGGYAYSSFTVETVPEPSAALGVLVFGAGCGTVLWKRRQQLQARLKIQD